MTQRLMPRFQIDVSCKISQLIEKFGSSEIKCSLKSHRISFLLWCSVCDVGGVFAFSLVFCVGRMLLELGTPSDRRNCESIVF